MVGNAVPVKLAYAIAKKIAEDLIALESITKVHKNIGEIGSWKVEINH